MMRKMKVMMKKRNKNIELNQANENQLSSGEQICGDVIIDGNSNSSNNSNSSDRSNNTSIKQCRSMTNDEINIIYKIIF